MAVAFFAHPPIKTSMPKRSSRTQLQLNQFNVYAFHEFYVYSINAALAKGSEVLIFWS
jgi:hypothetical protein